jgi:hypothetical protein
MRAIENRLRKLEVIAAPLGRTVVVFGASDADHEREIAALMGAGTASDTDRFVCVKRFSGGPWPAPIIQGGAS